MAQIGRGTVTAQWKKLDDVVEGFSPVTDSMYELQNIGVEDVQICEGAEAPEPERDGFVVTHNKSAKLKKESGIDFWVKAKYNQATINLGTL